MEDADFGSDLTHGTGTANVEQKCEGIVTFSVVLHSHRH